jgi:hypothetical protein
MLDHPILEYFRVQAVPVEIKQENHNKLKTNFNVCIIFIFLHCMLLIKEISPFPYKNVCNL